MLKGTINYMMGRPQRPHIPARSHYDSNPHNENAAQVSGWQHGSRRSQRITDANISNAQAIILLRNEIQQERNNYAKLKRKHDKVARQLYHAKQDRMSILDKKNDIEARYFFLVNNLISPYVHRYRLDFDDATDESMLAVINLLLRDVWETEELREQVQTLQGKDSEIKILQREVHQLQGEKLVAATLREQMRHLQNDMLAKVNKVRAISDDQFAQDFRVIIALVKSLSRSVRFPKDVSISEVLESRILLIDVPVHYWDTRARKKCFMEAWIWSVLIELIFVSPFAIFQHEGKVLHEIWSLMFGADHFRRWPSPSPQCETWRYTTMEHLAQITGHNVITHGEVEESAETPQSSTLHSLQMSTLEARHNVVNLVEPRLASIFPEIDPPKIWNIVNKAFRLALEMSVQRCRIQVTFPAVGTNFDKECMASMPNHSGEDIDTEVVAFIVNPGLTKWGDANGKKLDQRYDIVPSLVQLEPTGTNYEYDVRGKTDTGAQTKVFSGFEVNDAFHNSRCGSTESNFTKREPNMDKEP